MGIWLHGLHGLLGRDRSTGSGGMVSIRGGAGLSVLGGVPRRWGGYWSRSRGLGAGCVVGCLAVAQPAGIAAWYGYPVRSLSASGPTRVGPLQRCPTGGGWGSGLRRLAADIADDVGGV